MPLDGIIEAMEMNEFLGRDYREKKAGRSSVGVAPMECQSILNLNVQFDRDDGRRWTETQTLIQVMQSGV